MKTKSNEPEMFLVEFPAGSFIELADPLTGQRHMALVCDSGTEFLDYIDDENPATPFPIFDVLDPKQCGDHFTFALEFILKGDLDGHTAYSDFLIALHETVAVADVLTHNRAAKWAFESGIYDADQAAKAALAATTEARLRQEAISFRAENWLGLNHYQ